MHVARGALFSATERRDHCLSELAVDLILRPLRASILSSSQLHCSRQGYLQHRILNVTISYINSDHWTREEVKPMVSASNAQEYMPPVTPTKTS